MVEVINLRIVRKRAKRREDDLRARTHRFASAQPLSLRKLQAAQQAKAERKVDQHRIETGDDR